jgi:hypothetical protein
MGLIIRLKKDLLFWALVNFLIVALLGVLMRYKIAFEFPYFSQKHLQHAHSHFAFYGWLSHIVIVLLTKFYRDVFTEHVVRVIERFVFLGLFLSYGMLISFLYQGYGLYSILFSTLAFLNTIIIAFYFFHYLFPHIKSIQSVRWILLAFFYNLISSLGTFYLGYIFSSGKVDQNIYLASVYYFLHFQYNGWFFLACLGLFFRWGEISGISWKIPRTVFIFLGCFVFPAYLLSVLWWELPIYLYGLAGISAIMQLVGLGILSVWIRPYYSNLIKDSRIRFCFTIVVLALWVKYILQFSSLFPDIAQWAFGVRPVVIAYLHLNFLNILSLSVILFLFLTEYLRLTRIGLGYLWYFIAVISLNEVVLGMQGVFSVVYWSIPHARIVLFLLSILLTSSVFLLLKHSLNNRDKDDLNHI